MVNPKLNPLTQVGYGSDQLIQQVKTQICPKI